MQGRKEEGNTNPVSAVLHQVCGGGNRGERRGWKTNFSKEVKSV